MKSVKPMVNGLRQRIERLITEAGVKGGKESPHHFRHTCALWMLNNGSNIYHLKELLGHNNFKLICASAKPMHQPIIISSVL